MEKLKKVNLGCGAKAVKGWINIDKSWKVYLPRFPLLKIPLRLLAALGLVSRITSVDEIPAELGVRRHDVSKGLPFRNNEIDCIYTSHMIEHLARDEANLVLKECYRTLKNGGIVRIAVPDLGLLIEEYVKGKQAGDAAAADRFLASIGLADLGDSRPFINRILGKGHQWIYDFDSLAYRLHDVGFKEVKKCEPRQGEIPDLQLLNEGELHPDSIYLEAMKGDGRFFQE